MTKCHLIDIGSNTVKMTLYRMTPEGKLPFEAEFYTQSPAKLLGHIENGQLNGEGIEKLRNILLQFSVQAAIRGSEKCYCLSTAVLRAAENAGAVLDRVLTETGIEIDLISGEKEAECSYLGLQYSLMKDSISVSTGTMLDMGGGSTEIIHFDERGIQTTISHPFGSLSLSGLCSSPTAPTSDDVSAIRQAVSDALSKAIPAATDEVCLVGGTAIALTKLLFHLKNTGYKKGTVRFDAVAFRRLYEQLSAMDADARLALLTAVTPDRITTALPGLIGYLSLFDCISPIRITVSEAGVREGYLLSLLQ